jgi:hypothetical protein
MRGAALVVNQRLRDRKLHYVHVEIQKDNSKPLLFDWKCYGDDETYFDMSPTGLNDFLTGHRWTYT